MHLLYAQKKLAMAIISSHFLNKINPYFGLVIILSILGCNQDNALKKPEQLDFKKNDTSTPEVQSKITPVQMTQLSFDPTIPKRPQSSPIAAATLFIKSLIDSNEVDLQSILTGNEVSIKSMLSVLSFGKEASLFKKEFTEKYGLEEWEKFQDTSNKPEDGNATFQLLSRADVENIEIIHDEENDEEALFTMPSSRRKTKVVKKEGGWLIDVSSIFPENNRNDKFQKMMHNQARAIAKYRSVIGHKSITPEDIDADLGKAMMKAMGMSSSKIKYRFDIDKLISKMEKNSE